MPYKKSTLDKLLDLNPQFFREIKGRIKTKNVVMASIFSLITQLFVALVYLGKLPDNSLVDELGITEYSRYCFGSEKYRHDPQYLCHTDLLGHWVINWQLVWLDIFTCLSIISIFALLVVGTYMLIADLTKEESKGTLNFIRLTPQSASSILMGKILGVPILLYGIILSSLPLNFVAGLSAHIPLSLLFGFYALIIASCVFFYSVAIIVSLLNVSLAGFKPWLGSAVILFFLVWTTGMILFGGSVSNTPWDLVVLFHPGRVLPYLADATYLSHDMIDYFYRNNLKELLFYGQSWWKQPAVGMSLMLGNYALWTYWLWQGLKRRFHNPTKTILSKEQTYWFTGWFVAIVLGFTLQTTESFDLFRNFIWLQCFLLVMFLGLTVALSPHRQTLHDWARYRHQQNKQSKGLWKDLILGENSPSTVAIALNIMIATIYILPSLFLFPFEEDFPHALGGLVMSASIILLYAVITQVILLIKSSKRTIWAGMSILSLTIAPIICLSILGIEPHDSPLIWLFTSLPVIATEYAKLSTIMTAILGQWLAIALISSQMTLQLRQAGASETKMLFSKN